MSSDDAPRFAVYDCNAARLDEVVQEILEQHDSGVVQDMIVVLTRKDEIMILSSCTDSYRAVGLLTHAVQELAQSPPPMLS